MKYNKRTIGKIYEIKAKNYLSNNGYEIIDTNFFCKIGEIDIIAKNEGYLCFIEVKYREKDGLTKGLFAINHKKQNRIYQVSKYYLLKNNISFNTACRFDAISIDGDVITLIKNAFP